MCGCKRRSIDGKSEIAAGSTRANRGTEDTGRVPPAIIGLEFLKIGLTAFGGGLSAHFFHCCVEKNKWLKAVNRALPKEGWKVVALARLSPLVPFGFQNYLFGLTKVHLHDYLLATSLAILPGTVVYAFIGATGRSLIGGASTLEWSLLGLGLVATVLLSVLIGHIAS